MGEYYVASTINCTSVLHLICLQYSEVERNDRVMLLSISRRVCCTMSSIEKKEIAGQACVSVYGRIFRYM